MSQDMTTGFGLPGRVAIVTGAARGIGRGVADAYARFGAHVVGCDIDGEELSASMASVAHAERHLSLQCDLTESAACNRLVDDAMARYGRLDILVNVAGVVAPGVVDALEPVEVEHDERVRQAPGVAVAEGGFE